MTGEIAGTRPLRSTDPSRLGGWELLGRLGEGGMGTVYLARAAGTGRLVAVKMIRYDLAHDAEFRRRFRGEVKRARQVPPFCTAEVLDADPDHDPPYLVAEYVDGPSLATVVTERGPLTPGNLHGLAVGMATALTAIHGAGVIHRDLKPSNVLLPPGSPKVIDFGIARAVAGTGAGTRTDQVIGTVAYMAPERFEPATTGVLTPAADVFAWGAVVAYAGTGRTPFAAETPAATAVRILTQQPDLDGLTGPLRDLVEQALAKDPAQRPSARELLDRLLDGGPGRLGRLGAVESALAGQPELRVAVEQAQAVTDQRPLAETALAAGSRPDPAGDLGEATTRQGGPEVRAAARQAGPAVSMAGTTAATPAGPVGLAGAGALAGSAVPMDAGEPPARPPGRGPARRRGWVAVLAVGLVVLFGTSVGVGYASGFLPYQASSASSPTTSPGTPPGSATGAGPATETSGPAPGTPTATGAPDGPPWSGPVVVSDPLTSRRGWQPRTDDRHEVSCGFDDGLVVTKRGVGPYRCPGPQDTWPDVQVEVEVTLVEPDSCAAVWFRFTDRTGGHALRICRDGYHLVAHGVDSTSAMTPAGSFRFDPAQRLTAGTPVRVGIVAHGEELRFYRDGQRVGEARDVQPVDGRVVLGIFSIGPDNGSGGPYEVVFRGVRISTPD
ncbi:serine/threonine protein kinase [Plantactinospora sp. WMMB782]|uniref:serine/threonine protein kinase n=1 Tax=Plantactinospora sp. WMMB782 TaxID=3404121 RepID=UPI003B943E13